MRVCPFLKMKTDHDKYCSGKGNEMEDKIREVLYQSMSCRFKKLVVRKFLSEEYAVVHIETFVKELVKKLRDIHFSKNNIAVKNAK